MSLLNDASLIITPNAVKEGKLYSIIPSNGNGDMTVVRATATATRTNELGLIEPTPYNLFVRSDEFENSTWVKQLTSVTVNSTISPNGLMNADTVTSTTTGQARIEQSQPVPTINTTYTFSIYAKASSSPFVALTRFSGIFVAIFNLSSGTIVSQTAGVNATIISVGNGWYRISITVNALTTDSNSVWKIHPCTSTDAFSSVVGNSIFLWGAQLVQGSVPKNYFYTTDRLNVPRLNYDSVGGCPSILVEPQRTNLLLNSVWAGGGSTPTSWTTGIQTGTCTPVTSIKNPNVSAYRFVTSNTRQEFLQTFSLILNQVIAFSCYVESAVIPIPVNQMLRIGPVATANGTVVFLKNNVVITSTTNVEAGFTYSAVLTCTVAGDFQFRIGSGVNSNITSDITISMPQVELGTSSPSITPYSTSFIPTTIQTITRNADVITRNNIYTNNLITNLGGTWFIELNNNISLTRDVSGNGIWIGDNNTISTIGNSFNIRHNSGTSRLVVNKTVNGVLTQLLTTPTNTVKIAIDWNGTTADIFVNGVKAITGTAFTTTNMEFLNSGGGGGCVPKYIKSMMLFPKPLTDAECIALTTL